MRCKANFDAPDKASARPDPATRIDTTNIIINSPKPGLSARISCHDSGLAPATISARHEPAQTLGKLITASLINFLSVWNL